MRKITLKAFLVSLVILIPVISFGQSSDKKSDTVVMYKPKKSGYHYYINNHPLFSEVSIQKGKPHVHAFPVKRPKNEADYNVDYSSDDGIAQLQIAKPKTFLIQGEIKCKDEASNWKIYLYLEGRKDVVRTKEKEPDGSSSISKDKTFTLYWDRAPICRIGENNDTIGDFYISNNPSADQNFDFYIEYLANKLSSTELGKTNKNSQGDDFPYPFEYGILGNFTNSELAILFNNQTNQSYIFIDSELKCTFNSDVDYIKGIKKNERTNPWLVIEQPVDDGMKNDLIRLAFLSRYLKEMVSKSEYHPII